MKKSIVFLVAVLYMTGIAAYTQSLGDLAREEQKRRESISADKTISIELVPQSASPGKDNSAASPADIVISYLDSLKNGDLLKAESYVLEDEDFDPVELEMMLETDMGILSKILYSKISYANIEESINGDSALVSADITTMDAEYVMTKTMQEFFEKLSSSSSIEKQKEDIELFFEISSRRMSAADAPKITSKAVFELKNVNSEWKINPNDELMNILTGSLGNYVHNLEKLMDIINND